MSPYFQTLGVRRRREVPPTALGSPKTLLSLSREPPNLEQLKPQPVVAISIYGRHGHNVLRGSGKDVGLYDACEATRKVRCVLNREVFTGRTAPGEINVAGLGAGLDLQGQSNPRPESGDLHRPPAVNGGIVAALALVVRSPLPDRAIGLDGDVMPVPGRHHDNTAEAGAVVHCRLYTTRPTPPQALFAFSHDVTRIVADIAHVRGKRSSARNQG